MRILIVDAVDHARQSLKSYLELQSGFEIVGESAAASTALELVERFRPELVIMDVHLREMDGFAATRQMMAMPQPPTVILLAVHRQMEEARLAREAGAAAYIEKSAGVEAILAAIDELKPVNQMEVIGNVS